MSKPNFLGRQKIATGARHNISRLAQAHFDSFLATHRASIEHGVKQILKNIELTPPIDPIFRLESVTWRMNSSCTDRVQSKSQNRCQYLSALHSHKHMGNGLFDQERHIQKSHYLEARNSLWSTFLVESKSFACCFIFNIKQDAVLLCFWNTNMKAGCSAPDRVLELPSFASRRATMPSVRLIRHISHIHTFSYFFAQSFPASFRFLSFCKLCL